VEADLEDGWEDVDVHHDPAEKRAAALQMGANIVQYAFSQKGNTTIDFDSQLSQKVLQLGNITTL